MQTTYFRNVDLEIRGQAPVSELIAAWGDRVVVLHQAADFAVVELPEQPPDPSTAIVEFADLVDDLPTEARAIWNSCARTMDVGIEAESPGQVTSQSFPITVRALFAAAWVGASVTITVHTSPQGSE